MKLPPPISEEEFKEALRDCFKRGDIKAWASWRGWRHRSSGTRALKPEDPAENNLYEAYLDLHACAQADANGGSGDGRLTEKVWETFCELVAPLLAPQTAAGGRDVDAEAVDRVCSELARAVWKRKAGEGSQEDVASAARKVLAVAGELARPSIEEVRRRIV